ncbi:MAG TPA: alpha/beta fold hydrolase [Segetibacter sp.]|jgi:surfactin synthase thioesterase subunit
MNVTLFCLPFAGGSKYSLYFLKKVLPGSISCHFLDYPGRGTRIKENFAENIFDLVNDLYLQIEPRLQTPYALYGHSMGAKVAYLLALKIRQEKKASPLHLFVSGTDAPSVPPKRAPRHLLDKDEFISSVKELGGFPEELLQSPELLSYFEPILRADFKLSETYQYNSVAPLAIPLTVMVGDEEDMEEQDILEWQKESLLPIQLHKLPGDHFFIFKNEKEIGQIIKRAIEGKIS